MKDFQILCDHDRAETLLYMAANLDAVAGDEMRTRTKVDVYGAAFILDKEIRIVVAIVGDGCLKLYRCLIAGFTIGDCVEGMKIPSRSG